LPRLICFLLSPEQMAKIEPFFPLSHVLRVDDRRVISGIIYVLRHGLQWKDAPTEYGPHKTLYNRFRRWTELGVFDKVFSSLAASDGPPGPLMIDATHLKAHRTASSLIKGASSPAHSLPGKRLFTIAERGPHEGRIEPLPGRQMGSKCREGPNCMPYVLVCVARNA